MTTPSEEPSLRFVHGNYLFIYLNVCVSFCSAPPTLPPSCYLLPHHHESPYIPHCSCSEPASEAVCNDEAVSGSAAAGSSMPRKVVGWDGEERMAIANKWPKRKVAVIFGYCGTGYMGSQLCVTWLSCSRRLFKPAPGVIVYGFLFCSNPGVKTIDGELVLALGKSGFVLESNLEPLTKVSDCTHSGFMCIVCYAPFFRERRYSTLEPHGLTKVWAVSVFLCCLPLLCVFPP